MICLFIWLQSKAAGYEKYWSDEKSRIKKYIVDRKHIMIGYVLTQK